VKENKAQLEERLDELEKRYAHTFDKPRSYYSCKDIILRDLKKLEEECNVLYCGMADDVLRPILLVPDFDKLFVIDGFDSAFAKNRSWEGQKEDILEMLSRGDDELSHHREVELNYREEVVSELHLII